MLITCNNRGCSKTTNALVRVETKEVVCSDCGNTITNVSETMKRVLINTGHIIRNEDKKAFTMGCRVCHANRQIVLNDSNDATICSVCHNPVNVHPAMKQAILEAGERVVIQAKTLKKKTKKKKVAKKVKE